MSAIAKEFNFSAAEKDSKLGGEIAFGFFMVGGCVSVYVGGLADTANRCKLFMWIVLLGEVACLGTYLVTTFQQLLLCRILTGISIGGCGPIVYSILGDCFPGSSRVYVSTIMGLSMSVGVACGQLLAGFMGPTYGWRAPFIVIAIPAMCCGVLVYFTANEPRRGTTNPKESDNATVLSLNEKDETLQFQKILDLVKTPTVALCYLQGIPGCVPWSIITVFMSDYLSTDKGLSIQQATYVFTMFGMGGLCGQIFGGYIGQALYNRDKRLQCLFMGASTLAAVFPMLSILNTDFSKSKGGGPEDLTPVILPPTFLITAVFAGFVAAANGPNVRSVLQNVTFPENRGTAFALFNLSDDIGKGGGPMLVAMLVRTFGDRRPAFCVGILCWIFCGIALLLMTFTVTADEAHVTNTKNKKIYAEKI
eukprot:CAMPEP_0119043370 /NCGR_PEP_ID=MMETSP1177-20130426/21173_1 /TAXON_ID=2985 /ORGANISM="Ochromonas sp, Strain CCMP1899" /LENGTH=420 /DNA_ID=CAMNT_0007011311 /DNA_START=183 /DNA_END=1445 /DNA_ORIENTATION=+